jgi:OTU domain-containing protein 7
MREGLLDYVSDPSPVQVLERCGAINWHRSCGGFLAALRTEGDGNCLSHAANLAVFGLHDRRLMLRAAVRSFLVEEGGGQTRLVKAMRRAWERELMRHGVELGEALLDLEWEVSASIRPT